MKKLLLVTLMALSAGQAFARQTPKICPSWGCNGVPLSTLVTEQAKLNRAIQAKVVVQQKTGGGGCFTLANGQRECL